LLCGIWWRRLCVGVEGCHSRNLLLYDWHLCEVWPGTGTGGAFPRIGSVARVVWLEMQAMGTLVNDR
jgi:hypothetical protein